MIRSRVQSIGGSSKQDVVACDVITSSDREIAMGMHHIALSYQKYGDFPRREDLPSLQYMLATAPRSGSTMLALLMWRTGLLGAPMEYLNFPNSGKIVDRLGNGDIRHYWDEVRRHRSSPNGVFGYKVFIGNYRNTLAVHPELLEAIRADKVIYLRREDKIAQAVSHVRAIQSGAWFADVKNVKPQTYDFERLLRSYHLAQQQDWQWEKIFRMTGVEPLALVYEDVLKDVDGTLDRLCDWLGVTRDPAAALDHIALTKPQSDVVSREWRERFADELTTRERRTRGKSERVPSGAAPASPRADGGQAA